MRLIDADSIKGYLRSRIDMQDTYLPIHIVQLVDEMPTVDAVPVIRCKDCKFYAKGRCTINYSMYEDGKAEPIYCGGDEFCCWAEKR